MKINKNTANDYTYYEKDKKQYYVYCAKTTYFFQNHLELSYKLFVHSSIILSTNFSLFFHNFYSLNILQNHMIYHIHIHSL